MTYTSTHVGMVLTPLGPVQRRHEVRIALPSISGSQQTDVIGRLYNCLYHASTYNWLVDQLKYSINSPSPRASVSTPRRRRCSCWNRANSCGSRRWACTFGPTGAVSCCASYLM